jgi:hypothetical protein
MELLVYHLDTRMVFFLLLGGVVAGVGLLARAWSGGWASGICKRVWWRCPHIRQEPAVHCELECPVIRQLIHADISSAAARRSSMVRFLKSLQVQILCGLRQIGQCDEDCDVINACPRVWRVVLGSSMTRHRSFKNLRNSLNVGNGVDFTLSFQTRSVSRTNLEVHRYSNTVSAVSCPRDSKAL